MRQADGTLIAEVPTPRTGGRWEMGLEPHTEADVARTMSATLGFLAAATA